MQTWVEQVTREFRNRGLRITPQRRVIFQVLAGNEDHPTAEMVYEAAKALLPEISLATVYNTLGELVSMGLVWQLELGDGRARFDPNTHDHDHLYCLGCGELLDIPAAEGELEPVESHGYQIVRRQVAFYGYCPRCQAVQGDGNGHR